ncbi:MAG: ABC transporter ATP-binding protein [Chloroflexales bacterium]|nr:ABC transporter ATP-binding protein [Chloroflexales bacterium]
MSIAEQPLSGPAPAQHDPAPLLRVRGLKTYFPGPRPALPWRPRPLVKAVDGVDFDIPYGSTLGLVGESGSGKSTVARSILQLVPSTAGEVEFEGRKLFALPPAELRKTRRHMQIIFQDPYASLDPRRSVGFTIREPLMIHQIGGPAEQRERVAELLRLVGLSPDMEYRYPHEFSGGQRQRVGIARALATGPTLIIGDEPLSALDVSIQAQIINLLRDLQLRFGLTYLFISHDLRAVRYLSDEVAVMYLGRIVERAPTKRLFTQPQHPYTQSLLQSVPQARWLGKRCETIPLKGEIPSPLSPPTGCHFWPRCPHAMPICREQVPALARIDQSHLAACHLLTKA